MSATLDVGPFCRFFADACPLRLPGRVHPVNVFYPTAPHADTIDTALLTCLMVFFKKRTPTATKSERFHDTWTQPPDDFF